MKIGMGPPVAQNARRSSLKQFSPASRSVARPIFGNITGALIDARVPWGLVNRRFGDEVGALLKSEMPWPRRPRPADRSGFP